jgi:hypothetical protein
MRKLTIFNFKAGKKAEAAIPIHSGSTASRRAPPRAFVVDCEASYLSLYPLSDGRFQLLREPPAAPLETSAEFILAEKPLADFLAARALANVEIVPAIIYDRSTGEEYRTHQRVIVGERYEFKNWDDLPIEGERLFLLHGTMCASPALKQVLSESPFTYLRFSEPVFVC